VARCVVSEYITQNRLALMMLCQHFFFSWILIDMAPEVGLGLGYGLEADVFSFGIMLWEVCALKKPFSKVKSAAEFEALVFEKDSRPKIKKRWNVALKNLIAECWSRDPQDRPDMSVAKSILVAFGQDLSKRHANGNSFGKSLRSSIARRVTWD
jgi:hypothetical protein